MPTTPTTEPSTLVAGETWFWEKTIADYPSPEYVLTYYFLQQSSSPSQFQIIATDDAGTYSINVTATISAAYVTGVYSYQGFVTKGADKFLVETGELEIDQLYDGSTTDPRTPECVAYDNLTAAMANEATSLQLSYVIDGQAITEYSVGDKIRLIEHYRIICESQQNKILRANNKKTNKVGFFGFGRVQ